MNSNVTKKVVLLGAEELQQLTTEVKETVATDKRLFSAAELWQIQRQMKTASRQNKRWTLN